MKSYGKNVPKPDGNTKLLPDMFLSSLLPDIHHMLHLVTELRKSAGRQKSKNFLALSRRQLNNVKN